MLKILLACSAGMSTSLLEKAMLDYAAENNIDCKIEAHPTSESKQIILDWDICLLGPQVRFEEPAFKRIADGIPVIVIPPQIYAMAKGKETFDLVFETLKKK